MKKRAIKTMIFILLALTVLAGEALAGPGRGGRGGRQGWGRRMTGRPRMGANLQPAQPDNSWVPGPYCPFAQGSNQNLRGLRGQGRGGFGQGFVGRGLGPCGQGFGRWNMMMQRRPMAGRGGRNFQRRNIAAQGRGMNSRRWQFPPEGIGRPGPGMQQRRFAPRDTGQPMPPIGRGWAPGQGRGWRQGMGPGWGQAWGSNPQPQKTPDANAPEPPIIEDQTEQPKGE